MTKQLYPKQLVQDYIDFGIKFNVLLGQETTLKGGKILIVRLKQNKNYYIPFTFKRSFKISLEKNFSKLV